MTAEELERVLRATQETSDQSGRPHVPVLLRGSSLCQDDADQDDDDDDRADDQELAARDRVTEEGDGEYVDLLPALTRT
jgi:hypothetical protein